MQNVTIDRNKYIGGSDIPIIMGISPFRKRFDLLLEKASLMDNDFSGNEYTEYGNVMEEKIRNYINEKHTDGKDIFVEGQHINGIYRCHTDGENSDTILEIKTTSQIHNKLEDYKIYLVQLLFYMQQVGKQKGILAVYHRPNDFNTDFSDENLKVYELYLDDYKDVLEEIKTAIDDFLIDLEKVRENPMITEEELLPIDLTEISKQVIIFEEQLKAFKQIEEKGKELKQQLKDTMVKYGKKSWTTPNGIKITLIPDGEDKTVMKFDENTFKSENEDIYNKYLVEKVQKGKSGYVLVTMPKGE